MIAPGVEAKRDESGQLQLGRVRSSGGMARWLGKWLGQPTVRTLLDSGGTAFWEEIDGRRNLREITARLASKLEVSEKEAEEAVVTFTGHLMRRGLILLEVAKPVVPAGSEKTDNEETSGTEKTKAEVSHGA